MIEFINISKSFTGPDGTKDTLYNKLNFRVETGEFISIVGRSGGGKTTLLNMLSGLVGFDSGDIVVNNNSLSQLSADEVTSVRGTQMSFIFQQFHLIPQLTVQENIELPLDINKTKHRFEVEDIVKKVGLEEKINTYTYNLSGGEQQRVAIARAFIGETPILLADEPTGNLDSVNAKNIMDILISLWKETGVTVIMITHDKEVASLAQKTYILKDGELKLQ